MQGATLRVLAKVIGNIVAGKWTLLRNAVMLAMGSLLSAVLLSVNIVRVSFLLIGSVVVGVVGWGRGKSYTRLLNLRLCSLGGKAVELGLGGGSRLGGVERIERLLCSSSSGGVGRTKSAVLLSRSSSRSLSSSGSCGNCTVFLLH